MAGRASGTGAQIAGRANSGAIRVCTADRVESNGHRGPGEETRHRLRGQVVRRRYGSPPASGDRTPAGCRLRHLGVEARAHLAGGAAGTTRVCRRARGDPRRRGEAPLHRGANQGAAVQRARGLTAARRRQAGSRVRRSRRATTFVFG